jgi:cell division protein FtsQ
MTAGAAPLALPADVRWTQRAAVVIAVLAGLALLGAAVSWLARGPWFEIRRIDLAGDLARSSVATVRANAMPALAGNFFGLDLHRAQAAFESVPWVRRAVVRRVWPDRLVITLEEHRPAALWAGSGGRDDSAATDRLVNTFGEVFTANVGDVEDDTLPVLAGPEGSAAQVLAMATGTAPLFARAGLDLQAMSLSGRGSWRAEFDGGAEIELGRGTEAEVIARAERFVRTLPQVRSRLGERPLRSADLRHDGGYAVRLVGVTTLPDPAAGAAAPAAPARPAQAAQAARRP